MAKLTEFAAKQLLRAAGVATPIGRIADTVAEAVAHAQDIGGPVVLKAQILAGARGLAGGIRFAVTPDEVHQEAQSLLGSLIHGRRVATLLVEQRATIDRELYVGIISDVGRRAPAMIVSTTGGM